jgi:hypothetical protein
MNPKGLDDAQDAKWHHIKDALLEDMAFDHKNILNVWYKKTK